MLEVSFFRPDDMARLREITRNSFLLNAFNVDSHLPRMLKGEYFFENLARKAMQEHTGSCLVARLGRQPVGYVIHGTDRMLSERFGLPTATIMLFCVADEAQGKGVGRALLAKTVSLLHSRGIKLITVGTDSNNTAALNLYQEAGFRTRMNWGTYRFFPGFPAPGIAITERIMPYSGEKGLERVIRQSDRPIAFFREKLISPRRLVEFRRYVLNAAMEGILSGACGTLLVKQSGLLRERVIGALTYEEEPDIQHFFDNAADKKKIYRINDIVVERESRGRGIGTQLLAAFLRSVKNYHFLEVWAAMDNWPLLNMLTKCGFRLSHLATILHHGR